MFLLDMSNPLTLLLMLFATVLLIFLAQEIKKSYVAAIPLVAYLLILVMHVAQFTTLSEDLRYMSETLSRCIAIDFVFILISFFSYLWVDDIEAKAAVRAAYEHDGPVYMRFGRLAVPVINDREDYKFELGKGVVLREGKDLTIVATGLPVSNCLEAAEKLAADGIDAKVINIHTIKPLDEELIVEAAKATGKVVTVEEHSVIGGLGSAVCDVLSEKAPTQVMKIGINDTYGESGPALELIAKYGLDTESIYQKIKAFV